MESRKTKGKAKEKVDNPTGSQDIYIKGARVHNLKNVSVSFPRKKLIVVTGVSGSGKSSLTIDTLFAEGQRRYAESLSAYARQFMARMEKPDVDYIKGLCPAIAIEQKVITRTPRSTVGSMTEIYDYLRLLYARIGKTISPVSGKIVKKDDISDVVDAISGLIEGTRIHLLVKFKQHANRKPLEELNILLQKGFSRLYNNGEVLRIEDLLEEKKTWKPAKNTYILIDRLVAREFDEDDKHRIADSVGTAFFEGEGEIIVLTEYEGEQKELAFSNKFELDGIQFEEPVPNLFSFNNPVGACPTCEGYSLVLGIDEDLVIPDKNLSIYEGAVAPWKGEKLGKWKDRFIVAARKYKFPVHSPVAELTKDEYELLWKGNEAIHGIDDFFK